MILTLNLLRTTEARSLRAELLETAAITMGLSKEQANDLIGYWQQERSTAPPDSLLSFFGEAAPAHLAGVKRRDVPDNEDVVAVVAVKRRRLSSKVLQKAVNNLELVVASQTRMIEGLQRDIIERQEALQLAIIRHQVEAFQALNVKVDTLQLAQTQALGLLGSIAEPLLRSLRTFRVSVSLGIRRQFTTHTLSLCNHIS
jgi:hypothetical protein